MKREQFNEWLKRHGEAFPGLSDWIRSKGGKRLADRWFDVLKLVDFDAACSATDKMLGDAETVNSNYTSHPAKVKSITSGQSAYRARAFSSECVCKGTGYVDVLNDRVFKTTDRNTITARTVTVLCKCSEGQWKLNFQGGPRQGGGEYPRMLVFHESMRVDGVKYEEEPALSSQTVSDPFQDLPAKQPELYEGRGIPE